MEMESDGDSRPSPLVLPVNKLKSFCLQTLTEEDSSLHVRSEVQLIREPDTLLEFCELFTTQVIWIGDTESFASSWNLSKGPYPEGSYKSFLRCEMSRSDEYGSMNVYSFEIHALTLEKAVHGLSYLFQLTDNYFTECNLNGDNLEGDQSGFQLPCSLFKNMIMQNSRRKCRFDTMFFTTLQSRVFATSGTRTSLGFCNCFFEDHGTAFMEDYLAPENHALGPSKLKMEASCVLAGCNLIPCLKKLETLKLVKLRGICPEICRIVAAAQLEFLGLEYESYASIGPALELGDGGVALVESIVHGYGPRGLRLSVNSFDSPSRFLQFCQALRCPLQGAHLQRLELDKIHGRVLQDAVIAVLQGYRGLTRLGLSSFTATEDYWLLLLSTLWNYSSLQILSIRYVRVDDTGLIPGSRLAQVSTIIYFNNRIERLDFIEPMKMRPIIWAEGAQAKLEYNKYRERLAAVQQIGAGPTRGAILTKALGTVTAKPSFLYALLQQNCDVIVDCLRH